MKDIPNYEGLYAATKCGKIWSYRRGKFLTQTMHHTGYVVVGLVKLKRLRQHRVHRLIALCYLGSSNLCVNHIDANKINNNNTLSMNINISMYMCIV